MMKWFLPLDKGGISRDGFKTEKESGLIKGQRFFFLNPTVFFHEQKGDPTVNGAESDLYQESCHYRSAGIFSHFVGGSAPSPRFLRGHPPPPAEMG